MKTETHVGPYKILAPLGAGGMGEVFRARDTRLNRDVAVKVLPKDFAADADRLRRFEQEAKTLAALNHPNVLTVFDAGMHEGAPYLVSELLEGQTLREVLGSMATTALPTRKATDYALQIANGLAAAHSKGAIHRDLKPENLFVTTDGRVKILDFGLAKLKDPSPGLRSPSPLGGERDGVRGEAVDADASTAVRPAAESTEPGRVMGTPSYMAPEQVRGEPADHRADIFAFGCVLYEMLSDTRAFRRDTPVASMNAVLSEEPPDLSAINASIPPSLERVVRRCLEKQPQRRFQSADDLAFALENLSSSSSITTARSSAARSWWPWAAASLAGVVAVSALIFALKRQSNPVAPQRATLRKFELTFAAPAKIDGVDPLVRWLVISPNGRNVAYVNDEGLWVHRLDRAGSAELIQPEPTIRGLFWSPTSEEIGYFNDRKLYKISIVAGQPVMLCPTAMFAAPWEAGGVWFPDDRIIYTTGFTGTGLHQVSAKGGQSKPLAIANGELFEFGNPSAFPGAGVLLVADRGMTSAIGVWKPDQGLRMLLESDTVEFSKPAYSPTGHILFAHRSEHPGVSAFSLSLPTLTRTSEPFPVAPFAHGPSMAEEGTLLLNLSQPAARQLVWLDRSGKILEEEVNPAKPSLAMARLSPDETRVAAAAMRGALTRWETWLFDLSRNTAVSLTRDQNPNLDPYWLDNNRILFRRWMSDAAKVFERASDGKLKEICEGFLDDVSRSGKYLLLSSPLTPGRERRFLALDTESKTPVMFPPEFQNISGPKLSPDDALLAYVSTEPGQSEVYVVNFPGFTNTVPVSRGGTRPLLWNRNSSELFYLNGDAPTLMSVTVKGPNGPSEPVRLFDLPKAISRDGYDVSSDGKRFLMAKILPEQPAQPGRFKPSALVVDNWFEEFRE